MLFTKNLSLFLALFLLLSCVSYVAAQEEVREDVLLVRSLMRYVDANRVSIDRENLANEFLPLLGLKKEEVEYAMFGFNGTSRFFSFIVRKRSNSGETQGVFQITFCFEKRSEGSIIFEAREGTVTGDPQSVGVVTVWDNALGNFLLSDERGEVTGDQRHQDYSVAELLAAHKTINQIIMEHLENLESNGRGGQDYTENALRGAKWTEAENERYLIKFD